MALRAGCIEQWSALQAAMRSDFTSFVMKAFQELCPGIRFSHAPYIDAIAYQLDRISEGDVRRLAVTLPPRHLKSIMISVAWVAWWLGRCPEMQFICVSYSDRLAAKLSRDCRQVMESSWYRELFPHTLLRRSTEVELETTLGGGRFATSLGGSVTGFGANVIIIDDPQKADEAMSAGARKSAQDWVTGTLFSRLNDKMTGAIITVMQRLHEDDLVGFLLETGGWELLNLPAICEEPQILSLPRGKTYKRLPGDVLDQHREPLETLEQIRRDLGTQAFSAQYQQAPHPEGGTIIQRKWFSTYTIAPERQPGDQIIQSWDCASKIGAMNDYSACITLLLRKNTLWVLQVFRRQLTFPELLRMVEEQATLYRPDVLLIEDAASGQQLIQMLEHQPLPFVPPPIACKPVTDKVTRLMGCSPTIESGHLVLPKEAPWLGNFEHELLTFPSGKYDDQVDALSQALNWNRNRPTIVMAMPWVDEDYESPWFTEGLPRWRD